MLVDKYMLVDFLCAEVLEIDTAIPLALRGRAFPLGKVLSIPLGGE